MFIFDHSLFTPCHQPETQPQNGDFIFVYDDKKIGLTQQNTIPMYYEKLKNKNSYCFGKIGQHKCFLWTFENKSNLNFVNLRTSHSLLSSELFQAVAFGNHLQHFKITHRYCGKCAALMTDKKEEQAVICSQCSFVVYPKISPSVIVLITRGEKILLARSPHFTNNVMSTLAGFVTIGESIEQTVMREVKEEVGLEVGNLKYICSQPWPFPDSLMLGFTAEYKDGEIQIDHHEIEEAAWFDKNNLPELPNKMSIARYLIDRYLTISS